MVEVKPPTVTNFFYFFSLIIGNVVVGSTSMKVENVEITVHEETHDEFTDTFDIIIRLIVLVVAVFVAFISFWFVRGINTCDPSKMKPYLFFTGTFVFLGCCTAIVTLNFFMLVIAVLELYFFICAYSLYLSFLNDPNIQQDVVYKNPTAYGYAQAIESEGYANGGSIYEPQQQQPQTDEYYNQQQYFDGDKGQQGMQQQQQYYGGN